MTRNTETSARHIETLLETVRELPIHKLKDEMKELQDRQARCTSMSKDLKISKSDAPNKYSLLVCLVVFFMSVIAY